MEASPLDCPTGDASQVASSGLSPLLEIQVKAKVDTNEGGSRDYRVDQGDGQEQSALGSGTYSGRITETGYSCVQTHDPEIPAARVPASIKGTELEDLPAQSRCRDLGMRFFAGDFPLLPLALCVLHHRVEVSQSHPRRCDEVPYR